MRPVEGMLQTTVINPSATDSDALSTVVFVLDPAASRSLLASMPDTQAPDLQSAGQSPAPILHRQSTGQAIPATHLPPHQKEFHPHD